MAFGLCVYTAHAEILIFRKCLFTCRLGESAHPGSVTNRVSHQKWLTNSDTMVGCVPRRPPTAGRASDGLTSLFFRGRVGERDRYRKAIPMLNRQKDSFSS